MKLHPRAHRKIQWWNSIDEFHRWIPLMQLAARGMKLRCRNTQFPSLVNGSDEIEIAKFHCFPKGSRWNSIQRRARNPSDVIPSGFNLIDGIMKLHRWKCIISSMNFIDGIPSMEFHPCGQRDGIGELDFPIYFCSGCFWWNWACSNFLKTVS